jgi:deoxycytidine triphosphate deaminase
MFRSGQFVADQLGDLRDDQVQPNGVDLTLGAVLEQVEPGQIGREGKTVGDRRELAAAGDPPTYRLDPGGYVLRYADRVRIPEGHVGFIYPRSSLLRNSCMLDTAVWDAGYEGRGEGLLEVYHPIELEAGARVAQLVLARANHEDSYDGSYQGEGL